MTRSKNLSSKIEKRESADLMCRRGDKVNRGEEEKGSKGFSTQLSTDKYTGSEMWIKPVYQGCKQAKVLSGDGDGYTLYAADRFQSHQPLKRKGATSLNLEGGQGGRLACRFFQQLTEGETRQVSHLIILECSNWSPMNKVLIPRFI